MIGPSAVTGLIGPAALWSISAASTVRLLGSQTVPDYCRLATDEQTKEQTNRMTMPSRKAPGFVAEGLNTFVPTTNKDDDVVDDDDLLCRLRLHTMGILCQHKHS